MKYPRTSATAFSRRAVKTFLLGFVTGMLTVRTLQDMLRSSEPQHHIILGLSNGDEIVDDDDDPEDFLFGFGLPR